MNTLLLFLVTIFSAIQCQNPLPADINGPQIANVRLTPSRKPLFASKGDAVAYTLSFQCQQGDQTMILQELSITFSPSSEPGIIESMTVLPSGSTKTPFGHLLEPGLKSEIKGSLVLQKGINTLDLLVKLKSNARLTASFEVGEVTLSFNNHRAVKIVPDLHFTFRPAILVRAAGQDQVHTYRIPGLITTAKGTLIAVYDNRYLASGDLQGDIDVGMSRSSDGGVSWEPMKPIMDMGTYGGLPQNQNGVGDPSLLYDPATGTIWVAALWVNGIPGQTAWNGSRQGLLPGETGQLVLVKSDDDGISWSAPINITSQCKKAEWQLFFQGPGRGIALKDGTLVFPAQFKDDQKVPNATLIYSMDHGKNWFVGTGAKTNTTEAQVVQLTDGSLMLNMRDDRNRTEKGDQNGRAVSITRDLGKTWMVHPSSNSLLPESNCMASLIATSILLNGVRKDLLLFSNPNDKSSRAHMTIKASLDQGNSWPTAFQTELNGDDSYGYSCLTMVDDQTIGILYEGSRELYFQQIKIAELLGNLSK